MAEGKAGVLSASACCAALLVVAGGLCFSAPAHAFDGKPANDGSIKLEDLSPYEALRNGTRQYYSGDKEGALSSLRYAAENGQSGAAWKLGEMYSKGDGVKEDDIKAFRYYSQVIREHGENAKYSKDAPYVISAYVALGTYYLKGISNFVPKNIAWARDAFTSAAVLGDRDAQYELGRLYQGTSNRMAVRWYNLASLKGHIGAQARLGETLYSMAQTDLQKARALMWMTVARKQAAGAQTAWINDMHERYFALAGENVREMARGMADTWMERNRPDMVTAQSETAQTQPVK